MTIYRLKITQKDYEEIREAVLADHPKEAGAFALAGIAISETSHDILVRRTVTIPQELFRLQNEDRLEVKPQAINGMISLCESNQLGVVMCHSHPIRSPYSPSDNHGENRLFETMREFIPQNAPTASLLFYPDGVIGRVWLPNQKHPIELDEIIVLGDSIQRFSKNEIAFHAEEQYDRQVKAFGEYGQSLIKKSKIAIVGTGGTGSAVAEQLARLGAENLVLIDPDEVEPSNITRMYGTFPISIRTDKQWWQFWKKPTTSVKKVNAVGSHLKHINPSINLDLIPANVVVTSVVRRIIDCDAIFLCTDEHWGRSIVNQVAHQYLIPVINVGMSIAAEDKMITGGVGVLDIIRPDNSCLWCKQHLNAERIAAEGMPEEDRKALEKEGYVENLDTKQPSVISINTTVSSLAVTQFLNLLTGFQGDTGCIERLNYDVMTGMVRRGKTQIDSDCICQKVRGKGDMDYLPTIAG